MRRMGLAHKSLGAIASFSATRRRFGRVARALRCRARPGVRLPPEIGDLCRIPGPEIGGKCAPCPAFAEVAVKQARSQCDNLRGYESCQSVVTASLTERPMITDLSSVKRPIAQANGLPNAHYTDPATFAEERDAVLHASWTGLAVAADVP